MSFTCLQYKERTSASGGRRTLPSLIRLSLDSSIEQLAMLTCEKEIMYMGLLGLANKRQVELLFLLFLQPCVCVWGNCKIGYYDEEENVQQKLKLRRHPFVTR